MKQAIECMVLVLALTVRGAVDLNGEWELSYFVQPDAGAVRALADVPADANETAYALVETILNNDGPSCLLTTRQNVPVLEGVRHEGVARGAYVIYEDRKPGATDRDTFLFIATGSEVAISIEAAKRIAAEGKSVRVISMPSVERFLAQDMKYRGEVMPETMTHRVIVEAGVRAGWDRFRMDFKTTKFVTLDRYGASAPYKVLAEKFGFTAENVYAVAKSLV